jgi:hypothetical protein
VANADLSESLSRERITFGKIIYDLNNQLAAKKEGKPLSWAVNEV